MTKTPFSPFSAPVRLERIEPSRHCWRFYQLEVGIDLLGHSCLTRSWGRIGTTGQERSEIFEEPDKAQEALKHWVQKKQRRGYQLKDKP
ncbi:WGR domain-containing protein [Swingsia samuiensis]|uniref:WGR domain-containing protein n=1 Tax=Swingsia samuiensis TaxID=1293412 RepID=A0A4Y6UME6_9PROT|nr:WGR domain-containing protein [Swingsia samuiensis]